MFTVAGTVLNSQRSKETYCHKRDLLTQKRPTNTKGDAQLQEQRKIIEELLYQQQV